MFLLRVQSEGIPAIRASSNDRILDRSPIKAQSLIGLRDIGGEDRLVLKLTKRKNNRYGSVLMRPCFCGGNIIGDTGICPVHDFWPAVRRHTAIGSALFPSLLKKNVNRVLKGTMCSLQVEDAERYTLKGFRRGCIMEIKRSGSTLGVILGTGGWTAAGFRAYLSLQEDEESSIKALLKRVEMNIDSGDSADESPTNNQIVLSRRRKRLEPDSIINLEPSSSSNRR